jgi:hypothetical protein
LTVADALYGSADSHLARIASTLPQTDPMRLRRAVHHLEKVR